VLARIFSSLSSADLLRCALVSKVRAACVCGRARAMCAVRAMC
jgi:hypothetical protein